jgi:hypothetical protein
MLSQANKKNGTKKLWMLFCLLPCSLGEGDCTYYDSGNYDCYCDDIQAFNRCTLPDSGSASNEADGGWRYAQKW